MKRKEVYKVIDGERDYQDKKWGGRKHDEKHSINNFMDYMDECFGKAIEISNETGNTEETLDELRQVVALGIACMEVHGVPERVLIEPKEYV